MKRVFFRIIVAFLAFALVFSFVYSVLAAPSFSLDGSKVAHVLLIDAETGKVLVEKEADAQVSPASTVKIMTAILAVERLELNAEITVPAEARTGGTVMGVEPGDVVTAESLLYGTLMSSGNDAAVALAFAMADTIEGFAVLMNEKAAEIGMAHSHFETASGLDSQNDYVTLRDMAILTRYALQYDILRTIAKTTTYDCTTVDKTKTFHLEATNRLLFTPASTGSQQTVSYEYEYATGFKTGYTTRAKGCLVATAEKDGRTLIALLFGDASSGQWERYELAADLFDFGFQKYQNVPLTDFSSEELYVEVIGGAVVDGKAEKMKCVPASKTGSRYITVPSDMNLSDVEYAVSPDKYIIAPVAQGQAVGTVELKVDGEVIFSGNLIAESGMMTAEEYEKLVEGGVQVDPIELNDNLKAVIKKYLWIWLLVPIAIIAFLSLRAYKAGKRKRSKYERLSGRTPNSQRFMAGAAQGTGSKLLPPKNSGSYTRGRKVPETRTISASAARRSQGRHH